MKVYIIGTGPGDPELITLKAARIIGLCDVLVYDDLIPHAILALGRKDAFRIYVGKRGGKPLSAHGGQDKINMLLVDLAKKGYKVARLKGGDPFIFGRGGEEAAFLSENNIDFEIIPGITSAIAAPMYAGIPPTHRSISSSLHIATAHEDPSKTDSFLDWSLLAKDKGTLVFLMGASRIASIADSLIKNGMDVTTPCALVQDATEGRQRHIISILKDVGQASITHGITSPCVMIVGKVVNLSKALYKEKELPLKGKTILVTRPQTLAWSTSRLFSSLGANVFVYPLIDIVEIAFDIPDMSAYDMFIFTSQNAARIFLGKIYSCGIDARTFSGKELWAIGPKTKDALKEHGLLADGMAGVFSAEGIVEQLKDRDLEKMNICIPRAKGARPYLVDSLRKNGAHVDELFVYETRLPPHADSGELTDMLSKVDTVIFTSPSGVKNAFKILGDDIKTLVDKKTLVAIGPVTGACMETLGITSYIQAKTYTDSGIVDSLKGYKN